MNRKKVNDMDLREFLTHHDVWDEWIEKGYIKTFKTREEMDDYLKSEKIDRSKPHIVYCSTHQSLIK